MSGPYDEPDDPEDVTLWAGRLRPWPASTAAPTAGDAGDLDANDDATVVTRRGAAQQAEDVDGGADVDDTVIVPRAGTGVLDDTVSVRRGRTISHPLAGVDEMEDTAPAGRARGGDTQDALPAAEDDTAPGRRRADANLPTAPDRPAAPDLRAHTDRPAGADLPTGAEPQPRADPRAREAHVPPREAHEAYGPRNDEAVRVHRNVPVPRIDPGRDASLVRPKAPRRGVVGPLVIGATAVVVIAGALAAFVLLVR